MSRPRRTGSDPAALPLALWATPRTVSTAFDKMMRTRGDHVVLTEPFSVPWYFGPEQRSGRYPVSEPGATFDAVLTDVLDRAGSGPVFVKEMAYQLGPLLRADVLARFRSSFLIRDPRWSVPSLLRKWPDATAEEVGYDAQLRAFRICADHGGSTPVVLDSDALLADPPGVISRWSAAMGIEWRPEALTWEPGQPAEWDRWGDWFVTAARSTCFTRPADGPPPPLSERGAELADRCRAAYLEMKAHAL